MTAWTCPGRLNSIRVLDRMRGNVIVSSMDRFFHLNDTLQPVTETRLPFVPHGNASWDPASNLVLADDGSSIACLDKTARRWRVPHPPWGGNVERGCTWISEGDGWAIVPKGNNVEVVRLSLADGRILARAGLNARPAGIQVLPHPNGWTGLSIGEGQDAARAAWIRADGAGIEVVDPGWDDAILADVHPDGDRVLTTPHSGDETLIVWSWPGLRRLREIPPPDKAALWNETAAFIGNDIVAVLAGEADWKEYTHALRIEPSGDSTVVAGEVWVSPAGRDTWIEIDGSVLTLRQ